MCLSIPAILESREGETGVANVDGNRVEVNLTMIDDVKVGEYVLVHAGFAIQKYDEDEALETLAMLKEAFAASPDEDPEEI